MTPRDPNPDPDSAAALGPGDSSDSGSDTIGTPADVPDSDAVASGSGEGLDAGGERADPDDDPRVSIDDGPEGVDRVVGPDEAGLGGGLDQAEEARLRGDGKPVRR